MICFDIAIMAKAPVAGSAKTRLEPALGAAGAAALAERLLDHAVAQAATAVAPAAGRVTLWAAPDASHPAFERARRQHGVTLALQCEGDLGARMAQVFAGVGTPLLLMGTDAPALSAARLQEAGAALQSSPVVFVPALDGGYALVGLRSATPALLRTMFADMRWSHAQVMTMTRARLAAAGVQPRELAPVHDIDEPADLAHLPPGLLTREES